MAKRTGMLTDLMEIASKLPWAVGVGLALLSAVLFHVVAVMTASPPSPTTVGDMGSVLVHQFAHIFGTIFQYLVPAAFLIGAAVSFFKTSQRRSLFSRARSNPMATVSSMTWRQFEMLVGESFRHRGFSVAETGGGGPDGGVDLILSKAGERFLVQCKHWRSQQVSVTVVRELYGVMAAQGATGGYVVTAGRFTKDAREFAQGRNIELIDSESIMGLIADAELKSAQDPAITRIAKGGAQKSAPAAVPPCPRCGTPMVERVAKQGQYVGQTFWGCSQYPKCREILRIA
jgi:restriction system protein